MCLPSQDLSNSGRIFRPRDTKRSVAPTQSSSSATPPFLYEQSCIKTKEDEEHQQPHHYQQKTRDQLDAVEIALDHAQCVLQLAPQQGGKQKGNAQTQRKGEQEGHPLVHRLHVRS